MAVNPWQILSFSGGLFAICLRFSRRERDLNFHRMNETWNKFPVPINKDSCALSRGLDFGFLSCDTVRWELPLTYIIQQKRLKTKRKNEAGISFCVAQRRQKYKWHNEPNGMGSCLEFLINKFSFHVGNMLASFSGNFKAHLIFNCETTSSALDWFRLRKRKENFSSTFPFFERNYFITNSQLIMKLNRHK